MASDCGRSSGELKDIEEIARPMYNTHKFNACWNLTIQQDVIANGENSQPRRNIFSRWTKFGILGKF